MYMAETKRNEENFRAQMEAVNKMCHDKLKEVIQRDSPLTINIKELGELLERGSASGNIGNVTFKSQTYSKRIKDRTAQNSFKLVQFVDYIPIWNARASKIDATVSYLYQLLQLFRVNEEKRTLQKQDGHERDWSKIYIWNLNYLRICLMRYLRCIIANNSDNQTLTLNGRKLLTTVNIVCKLVDWRYDAQYLRNIGWKYRVHYTGWVKRHELMIGKKLVGQSPTLLFFKNHGTAQWKPLPTLSQHDTEVYTTTMQYVVQQHLQDVPITKVKEMETSAVDHLQGIIVRLEALSVSYPKYHAEIVRMHFDNGKYIDDIWPGTNNKPLFVKMMLYNIKKMKTKRESAKISDTGIQLYSSIYVWGIEYLVVCLMRLMYMHLHFEKGTDRLMYMNTVTDILKLSFQYHRLVSGLYSLQNLLRPNNVKPTTQLKLEYTP
jgi:hypothetical protein